MKDISFFSENTYVSLPTQNNPKVVLALGNSTHAINSFKLYNPFSSKAKIFKMAVKFLAVSFNKYFIKYFNSKKYEQSGFVEFLNNQFKKQFTTSVYYATLKDKVVVQLQADNRVFGYVKFPLNNKGLLNVTNEIKAIKTLTEKGIIRFYMKNFEYKGIPFFVIPELKGDYKNIKDSEIVNLLNEFKKEKFLKLKSHPRILKMLTYFKNNNKNFEVKIINSIVEKSNILYAEVYEHGDFAPWNLINSDDGIIPFDFEYFEEDGIEYFDLIKYHFQIGRLLKAKKSLDLFNYLSEKIKIKELKALVVLYLLKEIMNAQLQNIACDYEKDMLVVLYG